MPRASRKFKHKGAEVSVYDKEISTDDAKQMTEQVLDIVEGRAELLPLEKIRKISEA